MNDSPRRRTIMVGFFIFLGLVFFLGGILMVGNLHETFTKKVKVISLFDDVNGLQVGNNVWFSGVKVGLVSSINFYDTSKVVVAFKVDVKAQEYIPKDAKVKLSTDGLIGNKILVIYGGSRSSGEIMAGDTLEVDVSLSQEDMLNTLQESNKNLADVTKDIRTISRKLANGEGSLGKLINDNSLYENLNTVALSFQGTSAKAQSLLTSLNTYSAGLNEEGTFANELVSDTIVFQSLKYFALRLKEIGDTTRALVSELKATEDNPSTPLGVILHDTEEGARLKNILKNLESSSIKLDEDLEAAQHSFLLKKYFKNKEKTTVNTPQEK